MSVVDWSKFDHLFATHSDPQIAAITGAKKKTVSSRRVRRKAGIKVRVPQPPRVSMSMRHDQAEALAALLSALYAGRDVRVMMRSPKVAQAAKVVRGGWARAEKKGRAA